MNEAWSADKAENEKGVQAEAVWSSKAWSKKPSANFSNDGSQTCPKG